MTDTEHTDFSVDASDDVNLDDFSADFFSADKAPVKDTPEESEDDENVSASHETDEPNTEDEGSEGHEEDNPDEGDESDDEPEPEEQVKGKKKSRFQERIDDLTAKIREGDRQKDELANQLREAIARLDKVAVPETPQDTKKTRELVEPTADDMNEDGSPKYALGEFDPKLLRDLTRYDRAIERAHEEEVNTQIKAEQAEAAKLATLQTEWNEKVTTAKEVYPDYVEKGQELLNVLGDVDPQYAIYLTQNLMSMDFGPDVFYYLSEHPEEARAIVNSSPEKALNRLGRIEARFEIAASEKSGKETKLRTTNTPPPAPRNKGSNAQAPRINLADAPLDDFEREFFRKK